MADLRPAADDSAAPVVGQGLGCAVTPSGRVELEVLPDAAVTGLSAASSRRIQRAFKQGQGHAVLHLAVGELGSELSPSLAYLRELGKSVVSAACRGLDPTVPTRATIPESPQFELETLVQAVPPMRGAELVDVALLQTLWRETGAALVAAADGSEGGLQGYLESHGSGWHVVGRVCFHLAENRRDPDYPFAFIATYVHRVSRQATPQHVALHQALEQYGGARNRAQLVSLLAPLAQAAEQSEFMRDLVDSGDVYQPLAWTAAEAYRFLSETALYEQAGLVVRVPDWWSASRRPRPSVSVTVGGRAPSGIGLDALLDFDVALTLDGEKLSAEETRALLASSHGLLLLRGKWVEADSDQLSEVLEQWRRVQAEAAQGGVGFGEAMRMLAGLPSDVTAPDAAGDATPQWSQVVAGKWLSSRLQALRSPVLRAAIAKGAGLRAELRPYQKDGVQWLWTLREMGLGACLADDMGLGKTIQVIGLLSLVKRKREPGSDLLVVPASLIDNWRLELERFAPKLKLLVAHASHMPAAELRGLSEDSVDGYDVVLTTYGTAMRTHRIAKRQWRSVVLDEAQAIKNAGAKQTRAVKALRARWRLALTGTPIENRLGELWSIFDFLNPGLLGNAAAFTRMSKAMTSAGGTGYAPLRKLLQPYILRRLKTDRSVIADLPDKTEVVAHCLLAKPQAALYQQSVSELARALKAREGIERRGLILSYLMRLKQICDHPSQWLGDGEYTPADSGKFARLRELCEPIAARQDKVLVFTQFKSLAAPLAGFLAQVFGRGGLVLHGGTAVKKRQALVAQFQTDESVPFMVLSLKAGGVGLNLTAASHVIHFDRWWNPAVEDQATDRAYRIGQKRNVLVHKFVCRGTLEERIDAMIADKRKLSAEVLSDGAESQLTELTDEELMSMVSLDLASAMEA